MVYSNIVLMGILSKVMVELEIKQKVIKYEKDIMILHKENIELEKISTGDVSFQKAASLAAELDFTKKAIPIYLNNLAVALNK